MTGPGRGEKQGLPGDQQPRMLTSLAAAGEGRVGVGHGKGRPGLICIALISKSV